MYRAALSLVVVLLATGAALANAGPPKGNLVPADHTITTDKDYSDYAFYVVNVSTQKVAAVTFDSKTPIEIKGKAGDKHTFRIVAIPKGAEKDFTTEKALNAALLKVGGVKGQIETPVYLSSFGRVPEGDKRDRMVYAHKVEKFNSKDGIVLVAKAAEPKKDGGKNPPEEEELSGATAYTPRGGLWVAAVAASVSLTLGGLWFVGRGRRKV